MDFSPLTLAVVAFVEARANRKPEVEIGHISGVTWRRLEQLNPVYI